MTTTQSIKKKSAPENTVSRNKTKEEPTSLAKKADEKKESLQPKPYIQTKLSVSTPGDSHEQEADRVADEVVSRSAAATTESTSANQVNPGNSKPEKTAEMPQSLQTKISRMSTPDAPVSMDAPAPVAADESENVVDESTGVSAEVEQQITSLRGQGAQLPENIRTEMESQFSHDFSSVCIHNDAAADTLCKQLSARAFTVGSDIFFASGEYVPDSQEGKRLLAHELTHVVQQNSGVTRKIMRDEATAVPNTAGTATTGLVDRANKTISYATIDIPAFKVAAHRAQYYSSWGELKRDKSYGDRPNNQREVWASGISKNGIVESLRNKTTNNHPPINGQYAFRTPKGSEYFIGTLEEIANATCIPAWNSANNASSMEVDHIVEMQLSGYPNGRDANTIDNMELLDKSVNASSGAILMNAIAAKARATYNDPATRPLLEAEIPELASQDNRTRPHTIKRSFTMIFSAANGSGGPSAAAHQFWQRSQIEAGAHVAALQETGLSGLAREGEQVMVFNSPNGGRGQLFAWDGTNRSPVGRERNWLFPWRITEKEFYARPEDTTNPVLGNFMLELPGSVANQPVAQEIIAVKRFQNSRNVGGLELDSGFLRRIARSFLVPQFSPVEFDSASFDENGPVIYGRVIPTLPFLQNCNLDLIIQNGEIKISKNFSSNNLSLPSPLQLDNSSLSVFLSSINGLGIEGNVAFKINQLGQGRVGAAVTTGAGFALSGEFNFDERLFGEGTNAQVRIGYADHQWSMGGTITIPEGKVPGIRTATINVEYSEAGGFSARGDAQLSVPGVDNGTLEITHNETEGFVIGGSFNLSQGHGIRGGSISARVQEKPDGTGYAVSAHGEAQPDIPGINSNLIVDYNDGAFTAEVTADYSRGMLSGSVNAGVTNRTVNEDGSLSETAADGNPLIIYGGGQLTLQIAPWLQGTAGVRFAPNGEVTVTGEIGLPSQLEIFARKEINKSIFSIAIQAPIFPGVVAEVGGGLSATAGIGPGVIDQLRLGITYNPAHEDQTRITGDAHLNIPANAGLRLSVRAGIGLGIPGASATGGLDIGGTLGIEGAAEAGVHVEWTPSTGLDIQTQLAVHAQPSFTFDIGGYVSVRALGFSVYDNRWQFASYTFGSDYRFGIRLPIHYHEGEPFDISLDDVEFEVPDIDTNQLLRGLIARIA